MPKRGCKGYRKIASELREEWLADWRGGQKLPAYLELCERFGTTPVTMQRAMDLLADQGYITTRPTVGSFLEAYPPHTCQIGLVFPGHPGDIVRFGWSLNYLANLRVAQEITAARDRWKFRYYMDVSSEAGPSQGLARLLRDVEDGVLAGLIFSYSPHDLKTHPLITHPPLPIVHYNPSFDAPGFGIRIEGEPYLRAGIALIAERGMTDLAVLTTTGFTPPLLEKACAACGLRLRPEWTLAASPYHSEWVGNAVAALFKPDGRPLPRTLLIVDDHLVEPAVEALYRLLPPGVPPPALFGHWNFPLPYHGKLPITRFGYDARAWLMAAIDLIARHPGPPQGKGESAVIAPRVDDQLHATAGRQPTMHRLIDQARELLGCAGK